MMYWYYWCVPVCVVLFRCLELRCNPLHARLW